MLTLEDGPFPAGAKKLRDTNNYRLRSGDYRLVYSIDGTVQLVDPLHRPPPRRLPDPQVGPRVPPSEAWMRPMVLKPAGLKSAITIVPPGLATRSISPTTRTGARM